MSFGCQSDKPFDNRLARRIILCLLAREADAIYRIYGAPQLIEREKLDPYIQAVCPVQLWITCLNHIQTDPLILCQVLRCFTQRIGRLFECRSLLPRFLYLFSSLVICLLTAAFLRAFCSKLLSLLIGDASAIPADLVQSFHGQFNHMERINTALAVRSKLVYTVGDPACTVAGDDLDTGQLLVRCSQRRGILPTIMPEASIMIRYLPPRINIRFEITQ